MEPKEIFFYKAVENNDIRKVKAFLAKEDSFDINKQNPRRVRK